MGSCARSGTNDIPWLGSRSAVGLKSPPSFWLRTVIVSTSVIFRSTTLSLSCRRTGEPPSSTTTLDAAIPCGTSRTSRRYGRMPDTLFHSPSPSFIGSESSVNFSPEERGSRPGSCASMASKYLVMKPRRHSRSQFLSAELAVTSAAANMSKKSSVNSQHMFFCRRIGFLP